MAPPPHPLGSPEHLDAIDALWAAATDAPAADPAPTRPRRVPRPRAAPRVAVPVRAAWLHRLGLAMAASVFLTGVWAAATEEDPGVPATAAAGATGPERAEPPTTGAAPAAAIDDRPDPAIDMVVAEQPLTETLTPAVPTAGSLPTGKGMWIWKPAHTQGGDPHAIVARAEQTGLSHIYVRTGSSVQGFHGAAFLDQILPVAHDAGIRVFGWDFPYFTDVGQDIDRALQAITHQTPDGHSIDGFVPDIETPSEGTHLTAERASAYGTGLREAVGEDYPLVVCVPRPSTVMTGGRYPYDVVVEPYDAIIPMVYWLNRQPDTDVAGAIDWLSRYGKPIIPVGQAYDGQWEGGRPGPPPADEIQRFLTTAEAHGATGVSFWSWQHASDEIWSTYAAATEFTRASTPQQPEGSGDGAEADLGEGELRNLQTILGALGHPVPLTGRWDPATAEAVRVAQRVLGIEVTGHLDDLTRQVLSEEVLGLLDDAEG